MLVNEPQHTGKKSVFTRAIVRTPGRSLLQGLSSAGLGLPDYKKALLQKV